MFGLENTNSTVAESYETQGKEIVKLQSLIGKEKRLFGFIITKPNEYGRGVLLCAEDCMIALPQRYLRNFTDEAANEDVELLKSGTKKICNIQELKTKSGQKTTIFEIKDI